MSLNADGSVLLAGSVGVGEAYVMEKNGATWNVNPTNPTTTALSPLLPASLGVTTSDAFGISCGLSGDATLASVGAYQYSGNAGLTVTYSEGTGQWAYDANITPSGIQNSDFYGFAVSVASEVPTVVSGAPTAQNGAYDGAVYVSDFY